MSENNNKNDKKEIKISLPHLVAIESFLTSLSVDLETEIDENKKSYGCVNTIVDMITKIRSENGLCAEDGY